MIAQSFDKQKFIDRYIQVNAPLGLFSFLDDPMGNRPEIAALLNQGKSAAVIEQYDKNQTGFPADPRIVLSLIDAHITSKSLDRAAELAEMAIEYLADNNDARTEAVAWSQLARIAWRQRDADRAFDCLHNALQRDPLCRTALTNRLCYASMLRRNDDLKFYVADILSKIEEFDAYYIDFFINDPQIAYLRTLDMFSPVEERLGEID